MQKDCTAQTSPFAHIGYFYAADKGIAPPELRGYRQDKGKDTSKIMQKLNAIYKYLTESDGKEPMPMSVFVQRKEKIKELSKT